MKFVLGILFSFLLVVLCLRLYLFYSSQKHFKDGQHIHARVTLTSEPKTSFGKQQFTIKLAGYEPLFVTAPLFPDFHYGNSIEADGTIKKKLLKDNRAIYTLVLPKIKQIQEKPSFFVSIRQNVAALYARSLPAIPASLLMGIVFGSKEDLPKEFLDALQKEGLTHVIAASGMNVSMVAGLLFLLTGKIFARKTAILLAMISVLSYGMLTGFEPSILRAIIMSLIGFIAALLGKQHWAGMSLFITGFGMVFFNPLLITDVGFQLSFLATLGIMYLKPVLEKIFSFMAHIPLIKLLKEDLFTTFAAQLATAPVLLVAFGSVNVLSILSNLLVLWTIPLLMVLGAVGAVLGLISPTIGQLVLFLSLPWLLYFQAVVSWSNQLSMQVTVDSIPILCVIGYYLLLFSLTLFKSHEKTTRI